MDKQLLNIEKNISGLWDNEHVSLNLNLKKSGQESTVVYMRKVHATKTEIAGTFSIQKEDDSYLMNMIFKLQGNPTPTNMNFKVDNISSKDLQLSSNGVIIKFFRVS
ncbi:hypothetical protein [Ferruginibacter albus]|uniref:hypothetical protein n=1 Tax=Ferruginibacter albus TaxID=2875540 RepID=UPI001CC68ED1|nr:hypothetical protein [Ferruginibacter albus]UAY53069.1 hypothetical protein K9M53_05170 [Ferruginibacter albus]